jgi:predicted phosphodiesterase
MWLIGDIHGDIATYLSILKKIEEQEPGAKSIQIGDMGVGLPRSEFLPYNENHRWFRGNHDNPQVSHQHPGHLGDFGVWNDVFYVAGAWSIDKDQRTPMHDWWPDEELSWEQWNQCIELYNAVKPKIVVSHDCPTTVAFDLFKKNDRDNTKMGLQALFDIHQPDLWVFGHWHISVRKRTMGTRFVCLAPLGSFDSSTPEEYDIIYRPAKL